jgi:hypothetical protein
MGYGNHDLVYLIFSLLLCLYLLLFDIWNFTQYSAAKFTNEERGGYLKTCPLCHFLSVKRELDSL